MQSFKLMQSQIDPTPFLDEINSVDGAWDDATGRQRKITVQREALAIPLRGLRKSAIGNRKRRDTHESRRTTGSIKYPCARQLLEASRSIRMPCKVTVGRIDTYSHLTGSGELVLRLQEIHV